MNKFQQIKIDVTPIQRVRITHNAPKYDGIAGHWVVEYLPKGRSRWWWNWVEDSSHKTETEARKRADELLAAGAYIKERYTTSEVEIS